MLSEIGQIANFAKFSIHKQKCTCTYAVSKSSPLNDLHWLLFNEEAEYKRGVGQSEMADRKRIAARFKISVS